MLLTYARSYVQHQAFQFPGFVPTASVAPAIAPTMGPITPSGINTINVYANTTEPGVTSFDFDFDGVVSTNFLSPKTYTVTDLSVFHAWRARARNAAGVGPWSNYIYLGGAHASTVSVLDSGELINVLSNQKSAITIG